MVRDSDRDEYKNLKTYNVFVVFLFILYLVMGIGWYFIIDDRLELVGTTDR